MEIGVDVEEMIDIKIEDIEDIATFFSIQEQFSLRQCEESKRLTYFYDLWTLKESYIKMIGKGLSIPLHSFAIEKAKSSIHLTSSIQGQVCYFRQYDIDPAYRLSVCAKHEDFPPHIQMVDLKTIEKWCMRWYSEDLV